MIIVDDYIKDILNTSLNIKLVEKDVLNSLPFYIRQAYNIFDGQLYNLPLILARPEEDADFSISQITKHLDIIKSNLNKKVVLVTENISAINRRRLIEKGINFIAPGKQLFLPSLLLDLRENFSDPKSHTNQKKLLPSAQFILLYHLQHRYENLKLSELSFKEVATKFDYTPMGITKAMENLKFHELCKIKGIKEKYIYFEYDRVELWDRAQPYLINPVSKQVFVDEKPNVFLMHCNASALSEYSDMNPSRQEYLAIGKTNYYELQKAGKLINENEYEGAYCLEIWKYNPLKLAEGITKERNVDPLSLYLSLKDTHDERIEMALDQIIDKYIW